MKPSFCQNFFKRLGVTVLLLAVFACTKSPKELPQLGVLPDFQLTSQEGKQVSLNDYKGKVWVANFIFTSCAGTCPMLTQRMTQVQRAMQSEMKEQSLGNTKQYPCRIVSFSVDPERDTPQKLFNYAKDFKVDSQIWSFLTGPSDQVTKTIVEGFKISMQKVPMEDGSSVEEMNNFDVVHGEKFILVDQKARIRGYYDSDKIGIQKLLTDMKQLSKEG